MPIFECAGATGKTQSKKQRRSLKPFPCSTPFAIPVPPTARASLQGHWGQEQPVPRLGWTAATATGPARAPAGRQQRAAPASPQDGPVQGTLLFLILSRCVNEFGVTSPETKLNNASNQPLLQELPPDHPQVKTTPAEKCISTSIYFNSIYQVHLKN